MILILEIHENCDDGPPLSLQSIFKFNDNGAWLDFRVIPLFFRNLHSREMLGTLCKHAEWIIRMLFMSSMKS